MFEKIIHIKNRNQIRYGTTGKSFDNTFAEVMKILRKHGCEQILTMQSKDGFHQIGFTIDMKPYLVTIPKVYVNTVYDDRIGIRIVFRFLETVLELVKARVVDISFLMLSNRMVRDRDTGEMKSVAEYILPKIDNEMLLPFIKEKEKKGGE